MQGYLVANVLPYVAEGMVRIKRERPQDPIAYLADFLLSKGKSVEQDTIDKALAKFKEDLLLAEEMDRELAQRSI